MERISDIIGVLCISVLVVTILYSISSFPSTEKVIRFVILIYIVVNAVSMFTDNKIDFGIDFKADKSVDYKITKEFTDYLILQTEYQLEENVKKRLRENNISYNDVHLHILEQNGILTVDTMVIKCNKSDTEKVRIAVEDIITEDTTVIIGE